MAAQEPFSWKRLLHHGADPARKTTGWRLLLELEVNIRHTLLFLENPVLRGRFPKKSSVLEKDLNNLGIIQQTLKQDMSRQLLVNERLWTYLLCQADLDLKDGGSA